mmetsp:Transcript_12272/g.18548  ORF Transcript_12272/g.18548 Transcript_12272/m.18548 type:complete len:101 (-) Transcript_12272:93-395(-)
MAPAGLAELLKWNDRRERQRVCLADRSNALEDAMTSSRTPSEFHAMINALFLTAIVLVIMREDIMTSHAPLQSPISLRSETIETIIIHVPLASASLEESL